MTMTRVKLFGKLRQYLPKGGLTVRTCPEMTPDELRRTVAMVLGQIDPAFPGIEELRTSAVATHRVLAERDPIGEAEEFSLLPPVCGG